MTMFFPFFCFSFWCYSHQHFHFMSMVRREGEREREDVWNERVWRTEFEKGESITRERDTKSYFKEIEESHGSKLYVTEWKGERDTEKVFDVLFLLSSRRRRRRGRKKGSFWCWLRNYSLFRHKSKLTIPVSILCVLSIARRAPESANGTDTQGEREEILAISFLVLIKVQNVLEAKSEWMCM